MNPIIRALLQDFKTRQEITAPDPEAFEMFVSYCLLDLERVDQGDFRDTLTDEGEQGLDFVAIIINGSLIQDSEDVKAIATQNSELRVKYVFAQAKTAENWDGGGVLKFKRAVEGFFGDANIGTSRMVANAREVHAYVLKQAAKMVDNPQLNAYFVTSGPIQNAGANVELMNELRKSLQALEIFSEVKAELIGSEGLRRIYRSATSAATASISFPTRVTLPPIEGVDQAFLGLLSAGQLIELLTDSSSGEIRKSVFEDNVRDFQGAEAPVNRSMKETIQEDHGSRFAVLNNGITIIARDLKVIADHFTLTDYQVVNGAQTSHVLFENRDQISGPRDIHIPARIIQTSDEDLITNIVTATNSQTQIRTDQLNARALAERDVERFFAATQAPRNLLYERRSKQYESQGDVVKARVIDRITLLRSTASTFLDEAHLATGYPAQLVTRLQDDDKAPNRRRILGDRDEAVLYYAAASAYYRLDLFLKTQKLDARHKPARWHVLMVARHLVLGKSVPDFADRKIRSWVQPLIDRVWDDQKGPSLFMEAAGIVEDVVPELTRTNLRNATNTTLIAERLAQQPRS